MNQDPRRVFATKLDPAVPIDDLDGGQSHGTSPGLEHRKGVADGHALFAARDHRVGQRLE
jgi:hypothetical protein